MEMEKKNIEDKKIIVNYFEVYKFVYVLVVLIFFSVLEKGILEEDNILVVCLYFWYRGFD